MADKDPIVLQFQLARRFIQLKNSLEMYEARKDRAEKKILVITAQLEAMENNNYLITQIEIL